MIRISTRMVGFAAATILSFTSLQLAAQEQAPDQAAPAAPAPAAAAAPVFPPADPANFTAASPSKETVNAFLTNSWGYDETRMWQVQAILKTKIDGISKVVVYVGDKSGKQKPAAIQFFATADGKHILAGDEIMPFGAKPYAEDRATLQQRADGPYRGSVNKDLELVEFADFQCPHCKTAQANMEKLAVDFPKARIIFENYPLAMHPSAAIAAAYGVCVTQQGGSDAFFSFASAVFEGQEGLATADGATLTLNSAVTKAGLDPAKVAACAALPATKDKVAASTKLAQDLEINQTPTLVINGRPVPVSGLPYETLKKIIEFQAQQDGISLK